MVGVRSQPQRGGFSHVLVPVDLSDANRRAVEQARPLLAEDGRVTLLHVIETIEDVPWEELEGFYQRLEQRADRHLANLAALLQDGGVPVDTRVVYGKRAREILTHADEHLADLILLRSHPVERDPEQAAPGQGWATLSYQVAILARCAVMLVK